MLSWRDEPTRPTAADLKEAHAEVVVGGGGARTMAVRAGSTRFVTHPRQVAARARGVTLSLTLTYKALRTLTLTPLRHARARQVAAKLEELSVALATLNARTDLSAVAKAAWAGFQLLALHPFADGNGRLARALVNLFLSRGGVPFIVGFAASDSQRAAYRTALIASHQAASPRPFAAMVRTCVLRGWTALDALWASAKAPAVAAAVAVSRSHSASAQREEARSHPCMICLDDQPNCTLLCCGGAYHMRCLSRWLDDSDRRTCPQCRAHVPTAERPTDDGRGGVRIVYVPVPADDTTVDDTAEEDDTTYITADDTTVDDTAEEEDDTIAAAAEGTVDDTTVSDDTAAEADDTTVEAEAEDTTLENDDTTVAAGAQEEDDTEEEDTTQEEDDTEEDE